jgi:hypothetical protein
VRNSHGFWHVERVMLDGKQAVFIQYANNALVRRSFPLQEHLMSLFSLGSFTSMLGTFADYAIKNP